MAEYDSIAADYQKSKFAPWRISVEAHSLFGLLGDIRGARWAQVIDDPLQDKDT